MNNENKKSKADKTKELFNRIVEGVNKIANSNEYGKFLKFSKYFHNYSFNNIVLIYTQMETATQVAGFKTWEKMGRRLKKGAKGIQIMYPIRVSKKTDKIEGQASLDDNDKDKKTEEYMIFSPTYVFDISQTVGESMPLPDTSLNSNNMQDFFDFLHSYSPYPIIEKEMNGSLKGYWSPDKKHIALRNDLSIDDKTAVLLHELTHALYDDFNYKEDRDLSETFVESVAFIVADYFGLDTSSCSFNYIASWTKGDTKVVLELGNKIQKNANDFIKKLSEFEIEQKVA